MLSLVVCAASGLFSLQFAFGGKFTVQDDARHYVFWMQRYLDPVLFPNDLLADCFQSGAPPGMTALYSLAARAGIGPLLLSKLLPLPLGLIATGFGFAVFLRLLPVPSGAFMAAWLLNQVMWLNDDLISATPRAFVYPLFLAFLYYLLKRSWPLVALTVALLGLFFPPAALLAVAVLTVRLLHWPDAWPRFSFSRNKNDWWLWLAGMIAAFVVLLHYKTSPPPYGPLITAAQARLEPAFNHVGHGQGRTFFFDHNPVNYWLFAQDSGCLALRAVPIAVIFAILLPWWLRKPEKFPLAVRVSADVRCLNQILLASLGMFLLAHALLFELYFPSRYTSHSLRLVMPIAAALALTLALDALVRRTSSVGGTPSRWPAALLVFTLVILSAVQRPTAFGQQWVTGRVPAIYEFLARQPKETLVASLSYEADNIAVFARRPVLLAREFALPYQTKYYDQIRQRAADLIEAQYSPDLETLRRFIRKYRVDYFLIDEEAFAPAYFEKNSWLQQFQPAAAHAMANLQSGRTPALAKAAARATVVETNGRRLLDAKSILSAPTAVE